MEDRIKWRPPEARVTQIGRYLYRVTVTHGILSYGPDGGSWLIYGRRRAERKAHRALNSYLQTLKAEVVVYTAKPE